MTERTEIRLKWWYILPVLVVLTLAAGIFASAVSAASRLTGLSSVQASQMNSNSQAGSGSLTAPQTQDASIFLTTSTTVPGNCTAPTNGGVVTGTGCTFALDIMVNSGSNAAPNGLTAQQSYLTFTSQLISVTRKLTTDPVVTCIATNTVVTDLSVFDAALQNEVCNNQPGGCVFRGVLVGNGSIGYASGALSNCPNGCPDPAQPPPQDQPIFKVGSIPICANAPGAVTLHWQFSDPTCSAPYPPAPVTRDTELVTLSGDIASLCTLFADYHFTILGGPATNTPTPGGVTSTPTNTAAATNTSTTTPTLTPTRTNTLTPAVTNTNTPTFTITPTRTFTLTPAVTNTNTPTFTITPTRTNTTAPTSTNTPGAATNTRTNTTVPTNTTTSTALPATRTRTATNTATNTAIPGTETSTPAVTGTPCDRCRVDIRTVNITCNADGTIHWTAIVKNNADCTLTVPYRVTLQAKNRHHHGDDDDDGFTGGNTDNRGDDDDDGGRWMNVQTQRGSITIPPRGEITVEGDFCYTFPSNTDKLRAEFALDGTSRSCMKKKKSHEIDPCDVTPTCQLRFPDVPTGDAHYTAITGLASQGVISGYADGTFKPDAAVNRGQIAKMIVLAYELSSNSQTIQHFNDVPTTSPYFSYIETAYSLGVVSGYSDGSFHPYSNVTRAQLAKMVVQALGLDLANPTKPTFTDVGAEAPLYRYIETANANGLMLGYSDGTFKPSAIVTRGQVALYLDQAR